jgi:hypothetical protein
MMPLGTPQPAGSGPTPINKPAAMIPARTSFESFSTSRDPTETESRFRPRGATATAAVAASEPTMMRVVVGGRRPGV